MKKNFKPLTSETLESSEDQPPDTSLSLTQTFLNWQAEYKESVATFSQLQPVLGSGEETLALKQVIDTYHVRVPHYYLSLIKDLNDPDDPIRKQCVPSSLELADADTSMVDPLSEESMSPLSCLVHRYPDRVLLLVTGRCFMYCRHCTRKRLWRCGVPEPTLDDIQSALEYVRQNKQIREVIISGGDPLTLPTERLEYILSAVSKIPAIQSVRIGTRAPVVLPSRIDKQLCGILPKFSKLWINMQFNHPREITAASTAACRKLQRCGIPLSNQSVLLRGINDDPAVMLQLCQALQSIRVRPYYLFECDPVVGASHFRTSVLKGIEIIEKMRGHTGGMCVPTFVVDGVGGKGKIPLGPNYLLSLAPGRLVLRNYKNESFVYQHPCE